MDKTKLFDYKQEPKWNWALPIRSKKVCTQFLDDLMGVNVNQKEKERDEFITLLANSLSLTLEEKKKVLNRYRSLSQFQIQELINTFKEEREKFIVLCKDHEDEVVGLLLANRLEWAIILNKDNGEYFFNDKYIIYIVNEMRPNDNGDFYEVIRRRNLYKVLYAIYSIRIKEKYLESELSDVVNNYIYSSVYIGVIRSIESEEYKKAVDLIEASNLKSTEKDFLKFCVYSYVFWKWKPVDEKHYINYVYTEVRRTLSIPDVLYNISLAYYVCGELGKSLNSAFKSVNKYLTEDDNPKDKLSDLLTVDDNRQRNIMNLLYLLLVSGKKKNKRLANKLSSSSYKKMIERSRILGFRRNARVMVLLSVITKKRRLLKKIKSYYETCGFDDYEEYYFNAVYNRKLNITVVHGLIERVDFSDGYAEGINKLRGIELLIISSDRSKEEIAEYISVYIELKKQLMEKNGYHIDKNHYPIIRRALKQKKLKDSYNFKNRYPKIFSIIDF